MFLVKERSKGFKWFFSFLLFTEFRKKRTKNILFLLDEPASNLHSSAQAKILEAMRELSNDALVIYSTHSHHLIKPEWLAGAYICINESLSNEILAGSLNLEEGAKITAIKYYTYVGKGLGSDNVSYFQPILDRLDYQPSVVEPIPDIVILEGKNDWYTFKYFEDVILKRRKKLNFYPGAGRDKLYEIIRLYLAWGKDFIVLLDGDDGVKSQKQYIKEFGDFIKNQIFTLKDIFNKSYKTEQLIGIMDQRTLYNSIFGKGSYDECKKKRPRKLKENLNYALNQLQLQKTEVKLNKTTKNNFSKVFDFLQLPEDQFSVSLRVLLLEQVLLSIAKREPKVIVDLADRLIASYKTTPSVSVFDCVSKIVFEALRKFPEKNRECVKLLKLLFEPPEIEAAYDTILKYLVGLSTKYREEIAREVFFLADIFRTIKEVSVTIEDIRERYFAVVEAVKNLARLISIVMKDISPDNYDPFARIIVAMYATETGEPLRDILYTLIKSKEVPELFEHIKNYLGKVTLSDKHRELLQKFVL